MSLDKVNEEFESDFVNKYFKDNDKEKENNTETNNLDNDSKDEILKNFLDDKASEDYKDIHYNPRKIDRDSNFYKNVKQENKEELTPEQTKEKGDKIIEDLGKDYKNVHFEPTPLEGSSGFYDRESEELYEEGQELPPQQVRGLLEDNIIANDRDIKIYISEKDGILKYIDNTGKEYELTWEELSKEKKELYKRTSIKKMCKEAIRNTNGRRFGLKRKINPAIVKALDATGNENLIQEYIESIADKKELPFELTHDLSKLSRVQKWKLRKYIKAEEKCGAKIIGKLWNKNRALPDSEKNVERIQKEEKEELARNVQEIMKKEDKPKENVSFVQKVDGKNKEVAEKYRQESKREMDELLNSLGSEHSDTDKLSMADYINKHGVEAAKERYSKQFASDKVDSSATKTIDEKNKKELPENKQIAKQSEGESR